LLFTPAGTIRRQILPLIIAAFGRVTLDGPKNAAAWR